MNIQILDLELEELNNRIKETYKLKEEGNNTKLQDQALNVIKNIVSTKEIKELISIMQNSNIISNFSYESLAKAEETANLLSERLSKLKTEVELDQFLSKGYNLDVDKLKKLYNKKRLYKRFPDLDFEKIKQLYVYPPSRLATYYDDKKFIQIDPFVFRKYLIALIQMIFNHMDFVVCNVGDEGAGKSCKCSQDMYMVWWIMRQIKLVKYEFDIKEIFANTLTKFSELEDKYFGVPFRILGLDEGNELNRQDWKEDNVKLFWQRLRRERHEQRIKFINIPVLGEMIINIVLSRVNFIFNMLNRNETKTGTLYKGDYDFYIIPRGDNIFSPQLNKELSKEEIKNTLYLNLKDKEYLKGLPKNIRVKRCHTNGVWAFREADYLKEMKESNKQYTIKKGLTFGLSELYTFYKCRVTPKKFGVDRFDVKYGSLNKMIYKIKGFWDNDAELLSKYDTIFKQKREAKDESGSGKTRKKHMGDNSETTENNTDSDM